VKKIGQSLGMDATLLHRFYQGASWFLMMAAVGEAAVSEKGAKSHKHHYGCQETPVQTPSGGYAC